MSSVHVRSRTIWYMIFGVAPALPLVLFPLLLSGVPMPELGGLSVAALPSLGLFGLCLAAFIAPNLQAPTKTLLIVFLLACGISATSLLLTSFVYHSIRNWEYFLKTVLFASWLLSPTAVAGHYIGMCLIKFFKFKKNGSQNPINSAEMLENT